MKRAEPLRRVVLVVEDDANLRHLAAALLEETDLTVVEAASADEALAYLRENARTVALLFADIRLPGIMDGVDLARTVGERWPWVRILVTSGQADQRLEAMPDDAVFMPKPWRALDVLIQAERAAAGLRATPPKS